MTREYKMPDGTPVPAELQDEIAGDVRAFDRSQEPDARMAVHLRKISQDIPRVRAVLAALVEPIEKIAACANRRAVAAELAALADMGYTPRQLRETFAGKELIARYGLGDPGWPTAAQKMTVRELNTRKEDTT